METLPIELHSHIFSFACTDDGSTARALASVSHYVRAVARPYLYQSLLVAGLPALSALSALLARTPPHLRRVRHLFLSDWSAKQVSAAAAARGIPSDDAAMDRYDLEGAALVRVLEMAKGTLESLTLVVGCPFTSAQTIGRLFAMECPQLVELTVHGFYPFPAGAAGGGTMPRLERMHLGGNRNPHGLLKMGGLAAACPRLTHLRVDDLVSAKAFAEELEEACVALAEAKPGRTRAGAGCCFPGAELPPCVRWLAVQPGAGPVGAGRRYVGSRVSHEKMVDTLSGLAKCGEGAGRVRCRLVEGRGGESAFESRLREWRERMDGRDAVWDC